MLTSPLTVGNGLESLGLRVASSGKKHAFCEKYCNLRAEDEVLRLRFQGMPWYPE